MGMLLTYIYVRMGWWVSLAREDKGFSFYWIEFHLPGISPGFNFGKISIDGVRCVLWIINFNIQIAVVSKEAYRRTNVCHNIIDINKKMKRTQY